MATERPWVLGDATLRDVIARNYQVAILPWGATEAHNLHLPYATDTIESERVSHEAARIAWEGGARVVVLPAVPFGVHTGQLDIPLCLNVNPSTQFSLLRDLAESVARAGIGKLVIINGHGANDFKQMIRELQATSSLFVCTLNWYSVIDANKYFDVPGDHAGELETSVMQHLNPALVRDLSSAGDGAAKQFTFAAIREGWAWAPRTWSSVTTDTGVGDPKAATPAKGAAFFAAATERIAQFMTELAQADTSAMYA